MYFDEYHVPAERALANSTFGQKLRPKPDLAQRRIGFVECLSVVRQDDSPLVCSRNLKGVFAWFQRREVLVDHAKSPEVCGSNRTEICRLVLTTPIPEE